MKPKNGEQVSNVCAAITALPCVSDFANDAGISQGRLRELARLSECDLSLSLPCGIVDSLEKSAILQAKLLIEAAHVLVAFAITNDAMRDRDDVIDLKNRVRDLFIHISYKPF